MELALYHPIHGYYESTDSQKIGKWGDFVTSISVGDLFGLLLCEQLVQWTEDLALESPKWVEAGAHDGRLARDILNHCQNHHPKTYKTITYHILEPSITQRQHQETLLESHPDKIRWTQSWEDHQQKSVSGVIFSNELIDAFPVDRIRWNAFSRQWQVCGITVNDGNLEWCLMPQSCGRSSPTVFSEVSDELFDHLPDGFTTEISPTAVNWWQQAASKIGNGYLMTIDYALTAPEFFAPHRHQGTLRAYSRHHQNPDLLANPGRQDLTSHVNYTAVQEAGELAGLETVGILSQERFLTNIFQCLLKNDRLSSLMTPSRVRQFQSLVHPYHFGRSFSVLIQRRLPSTAQRNE
ncbi:MAG: hypothetical protein M2R46_02347 [Verrucomicrobia subdivision 3 bacterium]|nr:hypothetical protein [Limisphaerales bacterium]